MQKIFAGVDVEHKFVFGTSGSGRSYLVDELVSEYTKNSRHNAINLKESELSGFTELESQDYDCCESNTMFILDNGDGQFAVQLEIMLKCIKFAADEGKIPPIPDDWWVKVVSCCDRSIIER